MKNKTITIIKYFIILFIPLVLLNGCKNKSNVTNEISNNIVNENIIEEDKIATEIDKIDENNIDITDKENSENIQKVASINKQNENSNTQKENSKTEKQNTSNNEDDKTISQSVQDKQGDDTKEKDDIQDKQNENIEENKEVQDKQNESVKEEEEETQNDNINNNWKGMFEQPVKDCEITSIMYNRGGEYHGGINYSIPSAKMVYAAADGEIIYVKRVTGGDLMTIQHSDGFRTYYENWNGHNTQFIVTSGEVNKGQEIMRCFSGYLHFEIRRAPYRFVYGGGNGDCRLNPTLFF